MKDNRGIVFFALLLSVGVITLAIFVSKAQTTYTQEQLPNADAEKRGTIAWHVKRARARGRNKVTLVPVVDTPAIVRGLDDALSKYTVLVARLIEKKSYVATEDTLTTWNKFRVDEVLSKPANPACPRCLEHLAGPPDMLPVSADDVLIPTNGGSVVVNGVQVESKDEDLGAHFSVSQKYLLFVSRDDSKRLGRLQLGPDGVYVIDSNDRISPITSTKTPLNQDLQLRFGNSLNPLRELSRATK